MLVEPYEGTRMLLRVAVCRSVLQDVAVCCSVLQCVIVCCNVLQCLCDIDMWSLGSILLELYEGPRVLQFVAVCCSA